MAIPVSEEEGNEFVADINELTQIEQKIETLLAIKDRTEAQDTQLVFLQERGKELSILINQKGRY